MSAAAWKARRGFRSALPIVLLVVVLLGGGVTAWLAVHSNSGPSSHVGPEGVLIYNVPNLAPATTTLAGQSVDGISCRKQAKETVKYHIHVHVEVYVDGKMMRLPAGIGITNPPLLEKYSKGDFYDVGLYDCLYWLHTHVADGVIHVEAPAKQTFTLGEFFDIWNQPLGPNQVGPAKAKVVVFENGKQLVGNPRATQLLPHAVIQIDVGSRVVPFHQFPFKVTGGCGQGTLGCTTPTT